MISLMFSTASWHSIFERNMMSPPPCSFKKRAHLAHARGVANEGCGDEVDALFDAEQQIGAILVVMTGRGSDVPGRFSGFALAEQAGVCTVMDVAALDAVDGKLDKPVIDQDDRTGRRHRPDPCTSG